MNCHLTKEVLSYMTEKARIDGVATFKELVQEYYQLLKEKALMAWKKPLNEDFEDIFHNTLLNCLIKLNELRQKCDYMVAYFYKAFTTNMIRYFKYAYMAKREELD